MIVDHVSAPQAVHNFSTQSAFENYVVVLQICTVRLNSLF